jgi:hypothetical protein
MRVLSQADRGDALGYAILCPRPYPDGDIVQGGREDSRTPPTSALTLFVIANGTFSNPVRTIQVGNRVQE